MKPAILRACLALLFAFVCGFVGCGAAVNEPTTHRSNPSIDSPSETHSPSRRTSLGLGVRLGRGDVGSASPQSIIGRAVVVHGSGNSIMAGGAASVPGTTDFFPLTSVALETAAPARYLATHLGHGGQYVAQWFAGAAAEVDSHLDPRSLNIHVMLESINSVGHYLDTLGESPSVGGAHALADHIHWFTGRKAAGWYTVAITGYAPYGMDANHRAALSIINDGIRAAEGGVIDKVVSLDGLPQFTPAGPPPTTYVQDGTHLTDAGHAAVAALLQPAIEAIYAEHSALAESSSPLVGWWRSDLGVTSNAGVITAWADQSGSGIVPSLDPVSTSPTYTRRGGLNGRPYITGNGAQGLRSATSLLPAGHDRTVFIVSRQRSTGAFGTLAQFGSSDPTFSCNQLVLGQLMYAYGNGLYGNATAASFPAVTDGNFMVYEGRVGRAPQVRMNGASLTLTGVTVASALGADGFSLMSSFSGAQGINGEFYEGAIYDRPLSPAETTRLESYGRALYALP